MIDNKRYIIRGACGSRDQVEACVSIYRGMCIVPAWTLLFREKKKKESKEKEKSTEQIYIVKLFIYHERCLDYVNNF